MCLLLRLSPESAVNAVGRWHRSTKNESDTKAVYTSGQLQSYASLRTSYEQLHYSFLLLIRQVAREPHLQAFPEMG